MPVTTLSINGTNLETYGLQVSKLSDWLTIPKRDLQLVPLPLYPGQRLIAANTVYEPRSLVVRCYIQPASLADRRVKLNALLQALNGAVTIATVEDTTKVLTGYFAEGPVTTPFRELLSPEVFLDVKLTCPDPLWYDAAAQTLTVAAAATDYTLPIGSAKSRKVVLTINGPVAASTAVILKNGSGTELQRMTLTGALASGDSLVVDCDAYTITKHPSGGGSVNALSWVGNAETFLAPDPADSPKIQFSVGTGSVSVTRAWFA